MMVAPNSSMQEGVPMAANTLAAGSTPRKAKMGMLISEVAGMGRSSLIHQTSSQTQPARQRMPSGVMPSSGSISLSRKQSTGPRTKKKIWEARPFCCVVAITCLLVAEERRAAARRGKGMICEKNLLLCNGRCITKNFALFQTVLMVLRETCIFTAAQAARAVAAKTARVPHGRAAVVRRRRRLASGDSRDKASCIHGRLAGAFGRLCRPKAPLRETFDRFSSLLPMPVRLAVLGNGQGPCGAAVRSVLPPCCIVVRPGVRRILRQSQKFCMFLRIRFVGELPQRAARHMRAGPGGDQRLS